MRTIQLISNPQFPPPSLPHPIIPQPCRYKLYLSLILKSYHLQTSDICTPPLGGKDPPIRDDTPLPIQCIFSVYFCFFSVNLSFYTPPKTLVYTPPHFKFLEITLPRNVTLATWVVMLCLHWTHFYVIFKICVLPLPGSIFFAKLVYGNRFFCSATTRYK